MRCMHVSMSGCMSFCMRVSCEYAYVCARYVWNVSMYAYVLACFIRVRILCMLCYVFLYYAILRYDMYVCLNVCDVYNVCIICMHVCIHACMRMHACMHVWYVMHAMCVCLLFVCVCYMHACMHVCMCMLCMDVCRYIYIYICVCVSSMYPTHALMYLYGVCVYAYIYVCVACMLCMHSGRH